jgi:hypothetical protein
VYTCADNDPLGAAIEGVPRLSFHYGLASNNYRPEGPTSDSSSRSYPGCFDDAALA